MPFRLLHISNHGSLSLKKVTLTNGNDASGNGGGAIFVAVGGILGTVEDSEFSNNQASDTAGIVFGGALRVEGEFFEIKRTLFINNQTVAAGTATQSVGGAIFMGSSGPSVGGTISESIFTANTANETNGTAATFGGVIFVDQGASINTIIRSSFIANNSSNAAGAIYVNPGPGITTIDRCAFSFNTASAGGAILLFGPIGTISNSTFDNNIAGFGGAIVINNGGSPFIGSITALYNCTFNGNMATEQGGAIYVNTGTTIGQFFNSTVAGNVAGALNGGAGLYNCGTIGDMVSNIWAENFDANTTPGTEDDVDNLNCGTGTISTASFNLIGVDTNTNNAFTNGVHGNVGNIVGTASSPINPNLGVLRDNGGPTKTMALLSNSPAIGAGRNPLGLPHDQRGHGFSRMVHGQTDIGAFEVQLSRECPCPPDRNCRPDDCHLHHP